MKEYLLDLSIIVKGEHVDRVEKFGLFVVAGLLLFLDQGADSD